LKGKPTAKNYHSALAGNSVNKKRKSGQKLNDAFPGAFNNFAIFLI